MTKVNEKKRKLLLVGVTFGLCITIMLTGTFAWQSISQTAINETMGEMTNPGGRLHDDFDGKNKDIYVENFTDLEDGMPIIVRVRLFEYMEIGEEAGVMPEDENAVRDVRVLSNEHAKINKPQTWDLYIPGEEANNHYEYWNWTLGGKTVYMPTFNKDKDSLDADINGTYEGDLDDPRHFDDYVKYTVDQEVEATARYDDDDDAIDDGVSREVTETHTAVETIDGTVMNMAYWLTDGNQELGNYWVYDADGWAYWANPLWPEEATGLLLDEIGLSQTITEKWYYGIWVESQMVTANEIADVDAAKEDKTGFYYNYGEEGDTSPSGSAEELLEKIVAATGYTISPDEGAAATYGLLTTDVTEEEALKLLEDEETTTEDEATIESDVADKDTTGDTTIEDDKIGDDTTGDDATGDNTTGDNTTGDNTTGDNTTGDDTTGDDVTGDATTGNDTGGDATTGDEITETTSNGDNKTENGTATDGTLKTDNAEPTSTDPETAGTIKTVGDTTTKAEPVN